MRSSAVPDSSHRPAELLHHLPRHGHIQAGGGFIGDHQRRLQRHRQGDRQPLAHAATELVGVAAVAIAADADPLQQHLCPQPHLVAFPAGAVLGEGVGEVLANVQQRVEPRHRVLKHQAHRLAP